jgi:hypothetical protein
LGGWGRAEDKFNELIESGKKGTPKYKTIHIASITTILNFFLWEVKQNYQEENKGGLYVTRPNSKNKRLLMSDMPHFKYVHAAIDDFLYNLVLPLSLFYNVIIEGHEETRYDKDGDPEGDKLLASDSIAERIPTIFNETWQFKFKKLTIEGKQVDDYRIWFRNNSLAKTTFRELPDSICITDREHKFYDEVFLPLIKGETVR